jgi:hypothetical protein
VIYSPATRKIYWLAALAGLALLGGLCTGLGMWTWVVANKAGMATAGDAASPWIPVLVVLATFIPLHELFHLLGQPGWGMSSRSVLAVWPAKLRFGVYYEGCMSRRRWLGMRLAPFIVLSLLPACVVALLQLHPWTPDIEVGLQVMMLLNALGSGADIIATVVVLRQVPTTAQMCFESGRAYWRPA